ncbi:hypothetical protein CLV78_1011010 [Aliiruegeria haliotis]|uniref:Uncharacterized protein n=1 Tax=Aliiruegeria haliotis TaxID=1280846 RepID=A0A2T0S0G5_9RHOB|nr:hypothetical protein CLV78_1011010 [Aliiruegeria haliotis]
MPGSLGETCDIAKRSRTGPFVQHRPRSDVPSLAGWWVLEAKPETASAHRPRPTGGTFARRAAKRTPARGPVRPTIPAFTRPMPEVPTGRAVRQLAKGAIWGSCGRRETECAERGYSYRERHRRRAPVVSGEDTAHRPAIPSGRTALPGEVQVDGRPARDQAGSRNTASSMSSETAPGAPIATRRVSGARSPQGSSLAMSMRLPTTCTTIRWSGSSSL